MKRFLLIVTVALLAVSAAQAQPAKRRTTTSTAAAQRQTAQKQGTDRASLLFPTSDAMPEDVVWRRDIYRQLDLNKDGNAPLYYPVEPVGNQCNLFTYIFRLVLTGRVNAYKYNLDGNESFAEKDKITDLAADLLNRYYIYYEENNGKYTVADNDVPSAQVKRYYVKESVYLDQRTGTTRTKVVALCPILMEEGFGSDDEGSMASPKPLFWLNYEEIAPYLSKLPVMASNYNNVTNMTADDFFTMTRYDGKIYKTSNMQGKILQDYCKTDSALVKEQKRIEKQLTDFEAGIWTHKEKVDSLDSIPAPEASKASKKVAKTSSKSTAKNGATAVKSGSTTRRSSTSTSSSSSKSKSSGSAKSAPAASARRTRR